MDTESPTSVRRFELFWTDAAQVAMAPLGVVKGIDVISDIKDSGLSIVVDALLDSFFLEATEEGLCDSVVPAGELP